MGIVGTFLGGNTKGINSAYDQAGRELDTGYNASNADYARAADLFDPYVRAGGEANALYRNALLGAPGERDAAISTLTSNPLFSGELGARALATARGLNASGNGTGGLAALEGYGTGLAAKAGQRVFQETTGNWLDRYANLGQQGFNAAGAQGNALVRKADNTSNYYSTKAGIPIQRTAAINQARQTGVNNILGAIGTVAGAFRPTPTFKFGD